MNEGEMIVKILITGSKGQLGLEVAKQLRGNKETDLLLTDIDELDITKVDLLMPFMRAQKPDVVINCAAYTAVDDCETHEDLAFKINAIGPRNLAIASQDIGAKMVHISTDYVFNGEGILDNEGIIRPYNEFDHPDPKTVYGKTKYESEVFVRNINARSYTIRTAWLYGEGNNFVRTMLKLSQERDLVKVVNDQHGSPTSTRELARLITHLIDTDNYGLFHGTCEGNCTWYEFTKEIYRLMEVKTEIIPVTTEEYPRPARRPKFSVLDNYMLRMTSDFAFRHWKEEIADYLQQHKEASL